MQMKIVGALVLGLVTAAAIGIPVLAQQMAPADAVKARQDLMKGLFPNHFRAFVAIARGESTDIASLPEKTQLAVAEVRKLPALFPPGTGREAVPATRGKPEIWSERAEFEANAAKLADETAKLGDIAKGGNLDAVKAQVAAVNQACTGCHGGPPKSGGKFRFEAE